MRRRIAWLPWRRWAPAATSPSRSCRRPCAPNWSARWGCLVSELEMRQALRTAVDEVLERMFFAETLGGCTACDAECAAGEKLAVRLTFAGEPSGFLLLHMSAPAARQIAADFL